MSRTIRLVLTALALGALPFFILACTESESPTAPETTVSDATDHQVTDFTKRRAATQSATTTEGTPTTPPRNVDETAATEYCPDFVEVCIRKFYDVNMNGVWDDGEPEIEGWEILIDGSTNDVKTPICLELPAGKHTILERDPFQPYWQSTTPSEVEVDLHNDRIYYVDFGNVCFGCVQKNGVAGDPCPDPCCFSFDIDLCSFDSQDEVEPERVDPPTGGKGSKGQRNSVVYR